MEKDDTNTPIAITVTTNTPNHPLPEKYEQKNIINDVVFPTIATNSNNNNNSTNNNNNNNVGMPPLSVVIVGPPPDAADINSPPWLLVQQTFSIVQTFVKHITLNNLHSNHPNVKSSMIDKEPIADCVARLSQLYDTWRQNENAYRNGARKAWVRLKNRRGVFQMTMSRLVRYSEWLALVGADQDPMNYDEIHPSDVHDVAQPFVVETSRSFCSMSCSFSSSSSSMSQTNQQEYDNHRHRDYRNHTNDDGGDSDSDSETNDSSGSSSSGSSSSSSSNGKSSSWRHRQQQQKNRNTDSSKKNKKNKNNKPFVFHTPPRLDKLEEATPGLRAEVSSMADQLYGLCNLTNTTMHTVLVFFQSYLRNRQQTIQQTYSGILYHMQTIMKNMHLEINEILSVWQQKKEWLEHEYDRICTEWDTFFTPSSLSLLPSIGQTLVDDMWMVISKEIKLSSSSSSTDKDMQALLQQKNLAFDCFGLVFETVSESFCTSKGRMPLLQEISTTTTSTTNLPKRTLLMVNHTARQKANIEFNKFLVLLQKTSPQTFEKCTSLFQQQFAKMNERIDTLEQEHKLHKLRRNSYRDSQKELDMIKEEALLQIYTTTEQKIKYMQETKIAAMQKQLEEYAHELETCINTAVSGIEPRQWYESIHRMEIRYEHVPASQLISQQAKDTLERFESHYEYVVELVEKQLDLLNQLLAYEEEIADYGWLELWLDVIQTEINRYSYYLSTFFKQQQQQQQTTEISADLFDIDELFATQKYFKKIKNRAKVTDQQQNDDDDDDVDVDNVQYNMDVYNDVEPCNGEHPISNRMGASLGDAEHDNDHDERPLLWSKKKQQRLAMISSLKTTSKLYEGIDRLQTQIEQSLPWPPQHSFSVVQLLNMNGNNNNNGSLGQQQQQQQPIKSKALSFVDNKQQQEEQGQQQQQQQQNNYSEGAEMSFIFSPPVQKTMIVQCQDILHLSVPVEFYNKNQ